MDSLYTEKDVQIFVLNILHLDNCIKIAKKKKKKGEFYFERGKLFYSIGAIEQACKDFKTARNYKYKSDQISKYIMCF